MGAQSLSRFEIRSKYLPFMVDLVNAVRISTRIAAFHFRSNWNPVDTTSQGPEFIDRSFLVPVRDLLFLSMKSLATGIRFQLPRLRCIPRQFEKYIHGEWINRIPLPVEVELDDQSMQVSYDSKESLRLVVPWQVEGLGVFFLKTVCLPKREAPYDLVLEIARGTVGRLIDQTENWRAGGLPIPEELDVQFAQVRSNMKKAAFTRDEERFQIASVAIGASIHLMNQLADHYSRYVWELRRKEGQADHTLIAGVLEPDNANRIGDFSRVFNTAILSNALLERMPDPESCREYIRRVQRQGITPISDCLVDLKECGKERFPTVDDADEWIRDRARRKLEQGAGEARLIQAIGGLGTWAEGSWNDQEQIHLVHELVLELRRHVSKAPLIVGIDQPFGERCLKKDRQSPLQLVDHLVRLDTPLSAFCLEINLGYFPDGTWTRDLYAFNDLLDSWAQVSFPILVQIRIPSQTDFQQRGSQHGTLATGLDSQASWLEKLASLALSKCNVAGLIYARMFDRPDDVDQGAGLVSVAGVEKPAMEVLKQLRARYG